MPRNLMTGLWPLFFAVSLMTFALTACDRFPSLATQPPTQLVKVQLKRPEITGTNLLCSLRPLPPEEGTQADVAAYVREVVAWGDECESKLADIREILRPAQEVTP